jgi:hypothetical protein
MPSPSFPIIPGKLTALQKQAIYHSVDESAM